MGPGAVAPELHPAVPPVASGHRVPAGSLLICYTDGMIEGRGTGEDLHRRMEALGRAVHDPGAPLDELCEALLTARPADSGDDATLLVARLGRVRTVAAKAAVVVPGYGLHPSTGTGLCAPRRAALRREA
ncbi:hypothetical protein GCM10018781_18440 [Kitasatospora indigofera]|uniref:PPM-type phosphatase domain-containing protein n=2 Tax=Kitasatospora indigofera TaxID=67307 RepID=A0A919FHB7_9ACTN|nr:hypothetical protein GCM10018781_18440 [Kitasatospora indigofera]